MSYRPTSVASKKALNLQYSDPVLDLKNKVREKTDQYANDKASTVNIILDTLSKRLPNFENLNVNYLYYALLYHLKYPNLDSDSDLHPSLEAIRRGIHRDLLRRYNIELESSASESAFLRYYLLILRIINEDSGFINTQSMVNVNIQENEETEEDFDEDNGIDLID